MTTVEKNLKQLRVLQERVDEDFARGPHGQETTCVKGCAHCCKQMVSCSPVEALGALTLFVERYGSAEWMARRALVAAQAERIMQPEYSSAKYWQEQLQCVFLQPDKSCAVYEARPTPCRTHAVITEPALCGAVSGTEMVKVVDVLGLREGMMERTWELCQAVGMPGPVAPFQVGLLWAEIYCYFGPAALAKQLQGTPFADPVSMIMHWLCLELHEGKTYRHRDDDRFVCLQCNAIADEPGGDLVCKHCGTDHVQLMSQLQEAREYFGAKQS